MPPVLVTVVPHDNATTSYVNGVLLPAGAQAYVDTDVVGPIGDNTPDLVKVGKGGVAVPVAVEIASVAPTGPNPTAPQSLPPGTIAVGEAYLTPGIDGAPATQPVAEGTTDDGEVTRRGK